ncbi:MAG: PAS domain S-box protein, partial [Anaerolineaceae bacterium]|nr:PAS domain S-box protein [Anaerolineaceae bacterium]
MVDPTEQPAIGKLHPTRDDEWGVRLSIHASPLLRILLVTCSVLLSEFIAYLLIDRWNFASNLMGAMVDSLITTAFVFPVVYLLIFKPMRTQVLQLQELEKTLRQREADYRGIVEDQTELICWIDPHGKISFINGAFSKYNPDSSEKVLGQDYLCWFFPEDLPAVQAQVSRLTPDHPIEIGEYRQNSEAGEVFWFSWTIRAIYNPAGELVHYQAVGRDTTDYHRAMAALQEARDGLEVKVQQRTREMARINRELRAEIATRKQNEDRIKMQSTALEAAADGIMITDRNGVIQWGNPSLSELTGYPLSELIGQTPALFNSGIHSKLFYTTLWSTILAGEVWRGETYNRRKDGTQYVEEQTITPVSNETGTISNFIAIKHDITARKSSEEQISRRNWELQALNSVGNSVSPSLDINWRLGKLKQLLAQEMSVPSGAVYSYDPDQDRFHLEMAWGSPVNSPEVSVFTPIDHARVLQEKQPFLVAPELSGHVDILSIPLLSHGELQGVINLSIQGSDISKEESFDFLASLGNQIGVAIHNARLYKAEKQARQTSEVLRDASLALSQTLELDTVMRTLHDSATHLVPIADRIRVFTLEDAILQEVNIEGIEPAADNEATGLLDVHRHPLFREIAESRAARLVEDTQIEPLWRPDLTQATTRCWLGVPIRVAGEIKGFCCLESDHPGSFTHGHIRIIEALLAEAAVAIQNARLYKEIHTGRERLQALSRRLVE